MRIFIATSRPEHAVDEYVEWSVQRARENFRAHGHEAMPWRPYSYLYVDKARNDLTRIALGCGADAILYWDADQTVHCAPEQDLAALFNCGPVVGAAYCSRQEPAKYCVTELAEKGARWVTAAMMGERRAPFSAYWIGTGALWVRREVFDRFPFPWFMSGYGGDGQYRGEDVFFCEQLRAAGVPILCQPGISTGHMITGMLCHRPGGTLEGMPPGVTDAYEQFRVRAGDAVQAAERGRCRGEPT